MEFIGSVGMLKSNLCIGFLLSGISSLLLNRFRTGPSTIISIHCFALSGDLLAH